MGFVFQVKECSLGIKSMYTVNVYTLIFTYILIHGAEVMGIFGGKLTPVTVMFKGDINQGNHNTKNSYTQKESYCSLHIETHPVP